MIKLTFKNKWKTVFFTSLITIVLFFFLTSLFYTSAKYYPQDWWATYLLGYDAHINQHLDKYIGLSGAFQIAFDRYEFWTSRYFIELISFPLAKNIELWAYINSFIILLSAIVVTLLVSQEYKISRTKVYFATSALFLSFFSFQLFGGVRVTDEITQFPAGTFATVINYFWMFSLLIFAFYLMAKAFALHNKIGKVILLLISVILVMLAVNFEQLAVLLILLTSASIVGSIFKKFKLNLSQWYYVVTLWLISFLGILNAYLSPGNKARSQFMMERYQEYHTRTIFRKIDSTFQLSMDWLTYQNSLMIGFLLLILITLWLKKDTVGLVISGSLLFALSSVVRNPLDNFVRSLVISNSKDYAYQYISKTSLHDMASLVPDLYYLVIFLAVCYVYHRAFNDKKFYIENTILLISGILSTGIIALSPNIMVASTRPFIIIAIIIFLTMVHYGAQLSLRDK